MKIINGISNFFKSNVVRTILSYIFIIVIVILIRMFIFDPVRVDGTSMDTTLKSGEIMILNKIYYRKNDIKRFDIVVVDEGDRDIIKRVIGMPGETIAYRKNKLYINGKEMPDPYPSSKTDDFTIEEVGHTKIPSDSYFVMGDNRSVSADSRLAEIGVIKKDKILGRAKLIIWPLKNFGYVK